MIWRYDSFRVSSASSVFFESIAVVAVAFLFGLTVYLLGSFALTGSHTHRRAFGVSMREMFREAVLAVLTQPFLPLFYLVGYRMDGFFRRPRTPSALPSGTTIPIVFVHGYMQNRIGFVGLAVTLARHGFGPMYGFNYSWLDALEKSASRLEVFVARVRKETGAAQVDLVCHSMGGLVALEMLRRSSSSVRRCVTIASPHAGVMWRGPIFGAGGRSLRRGSAYLTTYGTGSFQVPVLSIYSTHDNVVHPKETSQLKARGGRDVEVDGLAHLAILFSPRVAEHVVAFLTEPDVPTTSAVIADPLPTDHEGGDGGEATMRT